MGDGVKTPRPQDLRTPRPGSEGAGHDLLSFEPGVTGVTYARIE
jgi:hypothetical protein